MTKIRFNEVRLLWAVAITILGVVFASCTIALGSDQTLVIGVPGTQGAVDPALKGHMLDNYLVGEGLTSLSPDFDLVPCIADSWETVNDNTWRFHLNKEIEFHDGTKLTADNVKESIERTMKVNPSAKGYLSTVNEISKVDDYTIDIITETPDASIPYRMSYGGCSILYKNNEESDGTITKPIGTGPFKFVSYDKASDTLVLAKNENYRGGAPLLDTITVKFGIADANSREMAIESGEVDFISEPPMGSTERLQSNPELDVIIHPLCQGYKLKFGDISKAPYDDIRVRQAIAYAVDRQSIVDDILLGRGEVADGTAVTPGLAWRNDDLEGYSYNVEKAKNLLEEAGWADTDGDGILNKDGQDFKIIMYTWPSRPALPLIEEAVQSQLKEIGIESETRVMDWSAISDRASEWGMIWVAGGDCCMMIPDPSYYIEGQFLSTSNDYHYANPAVDDLILEARGAFDQDKRYDLYKQVQKIVYDEDCAQVPIAYHNLCIVTKKDVKGYIPNPAHHDYCINKGMYRE